MLTIAFYACGTCRPYIGVLLAYIDDATSRIIHLHFTYSESTFSYYEATRGYLEQHGKQQAFYSDQYSVFRVNSKGAAAGDGHTQFGRARYELNIESICTNSSQAKGRVERANLTQQDHVSDRGQPGEPQAHWQFIDVYEYPDGRVELRPTPTTALPYATYDRLPEVNQGAIVENKRLGHVLQVAQLMQEQRDSRRGRSAPARTHRGLEPVARTAAPGMKVQRKLDVADLETAIIQFHGYFPPDF